MNSHLSQRRKQETSFRKCRVDNLWTSDTAKLMAAFAAKYGIEGLDGADGTAVLSVDGMSVEQLNDSHTHSLLACAEIGLPPPDAIGAFGAMMLKANFLLRGMESATIHARAVSAVITSAKATR